MIQRNILQQQLDQGNYDFLSKPNGYEGYGYKNNSTKSKMDKTIKTNPSFQAGRARSTSPRVPLKVQKSVGSAKGQMKKMPPVKKVPLKPAGKYVPGAESNYLMA